MSASDDETVLEKSGIVYLHKGITNESVSYPIEYILEKNLSTNDFDHITLIVSSWGGSVYAAFALTDIMAGSKIPIYTVGLGMVSSAGLSIFMSGTPGHRILTPNTSILSHQFSSYAHGKEHDLLAERRNHDLTAERLMRHYKKHTKLSEKKISKILLPPQDVWLSAEEALEYGICDKVKEY